MGWTFCSKRNFGSWAVEVVGEETAMLRLSSLEERLSGGGGPTVALLLEVPPLLI